VEAIDAVTLVANNPPTTARQKAAIQTVLINLDSQNVLSASFAILEDEMNQP
jgi:hypothetical protein